MPKGDEHDPIYPLSIYARFSANFCLSFPIRKIFKGKKKIVVPCLDVIMIAFFSPYIYSEVLFWPEKQAQILSECPLGIP